MILFLIFSLVAALVVFVAGRKDAACDPRLSSLMLVLLLVFPLMAAFLPKVAVPSPLPEGVGVGGFLWGSIFVGIWLVGFVFSLIRLGLAMRGLAAWRRRSSLVDRVDKVEIRELVGLRGPVAAGIFRPVIFVPESWSAWPGRTQEMVLAHEMAHHRRRDPLWRLVSRFACALYWFHPLVHWMSRRLAEQCEFACDKMVLGRGIEPKLYAGVLCDFADPESILETALPMATERGLEARVGRIFSPSGAGSGWVVWMLALSGLLAACALAMSGRPVERVEKDSDEVELRWTANPFPGN